MGEQFVRLLRATLNWSRWSKSCRRRTAGCESMILERLETRALLSTLPAGFSETVVASGLATATTMEMAPNGDLWVLQQTGAVNRYRPGSATPDVVGNVSSLGLDSSSERGLLGIAFDPAYAMNKQVYLYYTATTPTTHNRVSRFTVNDSDPTDYYFVGASTVPADAGSSGTPTQTVIFDLDTLNATNHNGGAIHFGPDGKLYIAAGDNGNGANSQSLSTVLGKILRVNSDGTIPADNPFYNVATNQDRSIWALGLRNPYTFTFQPGTGRMFINDVGQSAWEEIDDGIAGSNYGWPATEGNTGTPPSSPGTYRAPIYTYPHGSAALQGFAITGGAFYSPTTQQFPNQYAGDYFFADYINSWIDVRDAGTGQVTEFATAARNPVDLLVSSDGSLYYLSRQAGQALRINYANAAPTLSGLDASQSYASGTPALKIAPNLVVTNPNGVSVTSATVSFTNWQGEDRVAFINSAALQHTFTQDLTAHTATLTITGNASDAAYQTLLRSVTYQDVAGNPNTSAVRVATITVNNPSFSASASENLTVFKYLTGLGSNVTYVHGAARLAIAPNLIVMPPTNHNITSATITFTNWQAEDRLAFYNYAALQHTFTQDFVNHTATLTLTGTATGAAYQKVLRSVTYQDVAGNPKTNIVRSARITVNDGSNSASATESVTVTN